ncbi:LOW QUALITY PROTEIN: SMC5-SMC6 complex localization factor protein 2 [Thalassophryne amazonica]|uniref:LOW QUALITY PROTEIN: SMC5-SMC6 complex localization factor protein 2 n=1 Tax=Thalassophryne amazonica TaxID=390379 RepID=UPI0014720A34|nr:LOW QUALITY PROTEIN: SMC5-SMC6 complex localization factor protein 2 [Thalassophryne amazonica]
MLQLRMKEATENHGQTRALGVHWNKGGSELKVFPQRSTSVLHETPMKPSQVPNQLSHVLHRRMLPLQSPELCHKERLDPLCHLSQSPAPIHSSMNPVKDKQHGASSDQALIPEYFNCSSHKRCRDPEDHESGAKKVCIQLASSSSPQTPKSTCGKALSSLISKTSRHLPGLDPSPKNKAHQRTEPASGQLSLEQSSQFKHSQLSCKSSVATGHLSPQPSLGAKQAYIDGTHTGIVKLIAMKSPSKRQEERIEKSSVGNNEKDSPKSLSDKVLHKDNGRPHSAELRRQQPVLTEQSKSDSVGKTLSKINRVQENTIWHSTTPKVSAVQNCGSVQRNKTARLRKSSVIPDDIADLFTPDPVTYVLNSVHKIARSTIDKGKVTLSTCEASCSPCTLTTSSPHYTSSPCLKVQDSTNSCSSHTGGTNVSPKISPNISMPSVCLQRLKPEHPPSLHSKNNRLKNSLRHSSESHVKGNSVTSPEKHNSCIIPKTVQHSALEADTVIPEQSSTPRHSSKMGNKQADKESEQQERLVEHIDEELDLDLSFAVDVDIRENSQSSEEEQLLSLQEMMESITKSPKTPEKGDFSEPSTPGTISYKSKPQPLCSTIKPGVYKNSLDQMLKDINTNKRVKEFETELRSACDAALLIISECENTDDNLEDSISTEHQEFLKHYLLQSSGFREIPPGEMVFNLEKFGRIFNQHTLELRQCTVNPQTVAQKTLVWSSPAQLQLYVSIGLFQEAYNSCFPCPTQVTRFLFRMMSVHNERLMSAKILQILCDIACVAACQRVKNGSPEFKVWVPSLADVTLVLMNMGVSFVTLFPSEDMQPPFTEADLLDYVIVKSESPSSNKEQRAFPTHNCDNVFKYLAHCMGLCPKAFSDDELLLLLTVTTMVGLDTRLILGSSKNLHFLQHEMVKNIRCWDTVWPRICLALTEMTDDHHNMRHLVQLLPDNKRGKQLRRNLSLSMISKLLDGTCTYRPTGKELQISDLRRYLPRMKPSSLQQVLFNSTIKTKTKEDDEDDKTTLDQQAYYLCYSLLTLTNEATRFKLFPANQQEELHFLCAELEAYIKSDIRESEKCLYRSKVKDLEARIYTKWQTVLTRTRPPHDKLYHHWQPPTNNRLTGTQEQTRDNRNEDDKAVSEEETEMEDEDDEFVMDAVEVRIEAEKERNQEENVEHPQQDNTVDDSNKKKED